MRKNRKRLTVVVAVLALILITLGVISYEKATLQTGADTQGHANYGYAGSPGRKTTKDDRTAGKPEYATVVKTIGGSGGTSATEAPNTEVSLPGTPVRDTIYVCVSYGTGPGDTNDVNTNPDITYYDAEQLEKGLLYELKQYAGDFVQAQDTYHIDAVFLAAVAAEESGYGRYTFRKNNIFGYGTNDFDNVPQCIDYVACKLRDNYLTPGGIYYEGCSVEQIGIHYNGRSTWVANVRQIMYEIIERIDTE